MRLTRPALALSAAAVLLSPLLAHAVSAPAAPAAPSVRTTAALPTSWPAVPVAERLQPWLAAELAKGGTAPLRVMVSGTTIDAATEAATEAGMTIQQTWRSSGIVVAIGSPEQIRDVVGQDGVRAVDGDQPLAPALETAHVATRSNDALAAYTAADGVSRIGGAGSSVAVIDSGIDGRHPFFQRGGKSTVVRNLKNVCTILTGPTDTCFQHDPTNDTDTTSVGGHGTHVAGITGGVDTVLSDGTKLRGSAPDVSLVGLSVGATLSIINANAAMQWVADHHRQPCRPANQQDGPADPSCPPIKATNHSYGPASVPAGGHKFRESDPAVTIQRNLVTQGVTVVWAAGNSAGDGSVATTNPPAMDFTPGVLMIASYDDADSGTRDNQLSSFSSRGKKDAFETYPDLSAPGDGITSSCRPYLAVCSTGFDFRNGPGAADIGTFNTISGTSMATPYVAGVVAQLVQAKPGITPGEIEALLENNAHRFGGDYQPDPTNGTTPTSFDKGHGLVDVAATLAAALGTTAPGAPAPTCTTTSFQVVDPTGDATQVVLLDTPLPSQDSLDVQKAYLLYDDAAQTLTFRIGVTDLAAGPPAGSVGEFFRFYFTRGTDPELFVTANRNGTGQRFSLRQQGGASVPLSGAFNTATDEVSVTMPLGDYTKVLADKRLALGDTLDVGQVLGQRDGNGVTLTADTAAGTCPFVLGTSTPAETVEPAPTASASPDPEPTQATSPEPSPEPSPAPSQSASPEPTETGTASPSPSPTCQPKNGNGKGCRK
jgi:subtilisin family serine protease